MDGENVCLSIAVDISHADAVTVLVMSADVMDRGFGSRKTNPKEALSSVVRGNKLHLTVAVDITLHNTFRLLGVAYEVGFPYLAQSARVFEPPHSVVLPRGGHQIQSAIVIHVNCELTVIWHEFSPERLISYLGDFGGSAWEKRCEIAKFVALPLSPYEAGVLVPVCSAGDVRFAVAIHVYDGKPFRMVRPEPVRKKSDGRGAVKRRHEFPFLGIELRREFHASKNGPIRKYH